MNGRPTRPQVVRTKLAPAPLPAGLVVRDRVMDRFSMDDRFTLVSALPGFGKTAAVRHWIDSVDESVAWLSLDMLDEDPFAFWSNVLLVLGSARPGLANEPAMLLWERGPDDPLFLAALVAGLDELGSPTVLVLDGLSERVGGGAIDGLALLVERAGEALRIVVTTRSDPPLPTARWRTHGWLNEIREDALRLTDEEAVAIAARHDGSIGEEEAVVLNHRVDHWPIGFHMALLARTAGGDAPSHACDPIGSDRVLAGTLVAEVLEAMSEDERDVALALCVLERFDPDLCVQMVGPNATDAVRKLLQRGVFLSVVDPRTGMMRFHDLFRELMETELGYRDPAVRLDQHRRAAMLWRERGDLMSAYHHLAVIGETAKASELLVDPTLDLVDRGDLDALHRLARHLPTPQQVTNANLAIDLAVVSLYAQGTIASRRWCDRTEQLLDDGERDEYLGLRLVGLLCTIALLDADLDTALALLAAHPLATADVDDVFEQRLPIIATRVMMAARREADANDWISVAERVAGPEIVTQVTVPTLRAWHQWMFGSLQRACGLIDGALAWINDNQIGRHHLAFDTLITGGWCRLATGDFADAARLADQAWSDAESIGCAWNHLQAGHLCARLALVTGEPGRALQLIDGLRNTISFASCRSYADRLLSLEIEAMAAAGRTRDAVSMIDDLDPGPRRQLLRAQLDAASGLQIEHLLAERSNWPVFDRIQADLLVTTRAGAGSPADKLIELVTACADEGWVLPLLGMGPRVERLLREQPLSTIHPELERTLDFVAPALPLETHHGHDVRLTSRELTIVQLLPTHLSNAEIGERLFLSVNTVKSNLKAIYRKLDVTTRTEAVEAARMAGLI